MRMWVASGGWWVSGWGAWWVHVCGYGHGGYVSGGLVGMVWDGGMVGKWVWVGQPVEPRTQS